MPKTDPLEDALDELDWLVNEASDEIRDFIIDCDTSKASPQLIKLLGHSLGQMLYRNAEGSRRYLTNQIAGLRAAQKQAK